MNHAVVAAEIAAAVAVLGRHRLGAIVLVDPAVAVEGGVVVDAMVTRDLLVAIFVPEYLNRLHRGAIVVRRDRIKRAAVPISWEDVVGRAADLAAGVAIAVDEDTGKIRIVDRTTHVEVVGVDELVDALRRHALL